MQKLKIDYTDIKQTPSGELFKILHVSADYRRELEAELLEAKHREEEIRQELRHRNLTV